MYNKRNNQKKCFLFAMMLVGTGLSSKVQHASRYVYAELLADLHRQLVSKIAHAC